MSENQIRAVAHFEIQPGSRAEFETLAKEAANYCDTDEPGTLIYDWYIGEDGTSARIYELYESSEAILAHLGGKVGTEMLPKIMEVAPLTKIEAFGSPSQQLVKAVEALPVIFYGKAVAGMNS